MTAKTRIASIRWPAIGKLSGLGSSNTPISAATANNRPQLRRIQLGCAVCATLAAGDVCSAIATISLRSLAAHESVRRKEAVDLRQIKGQRARALISCGPTEVNVADDVLCRRAHSP